ncbi:MAG: T9SS type A sorting domain-containing protein [Chitinophagaceae bacterium]|nr:T9SS type A sorting domain-containing protein [Chitinophagaceae bacterium]
MKTMHTKTYATFILTLLLMAFMIPDNNAHAQLVYSTILDNSGFTADLDNINGASLTFDGGVIAAGQIMNNASGKAWGPGIVTKLNSDGTPLWWYGIESYHPDSITIQGNDLRFADAIEDAGGSLVASGQYKIAGRDKSDAILLKINSAGTIQWFKRYHLNAEHAPGIIISDLAQLPNHKYVATGVAGEGYSKGGWLWFRTDVNGGNPIVKTFWHSKRAAGVNILPQADNSSVVAWNSGTNGSDGDFYPVFSRVDADGNLLTEKWVVLDYNSILTDCIQTADGGFAGVGCGVSESFLLKLDASLNVQWIRSWPIGSAASGSNVTPTFKNVIELSSGNFDISGAYFPTLNPSVYENLLVTTDGSGNIISANTLSQSASTQEKVQRSLELPDGRIISLGFVGTSNNTSDISVFHENAAGVTACTSTPLSISPTSSGVLFEKNKPLISPTVYTVNIQKDTLTIKTTFNQTTICSPLHLTAEIENSDFHVYPNPTSDRITINLPDNRFDETFELIITGIDGRVLIKTIIAETTSDISVQSWPAGLYTYRLSAKDGTQTTGIFVKQ